MDFTTLATLFGSVGFIAAATILAALLFTILSTGSFHILRQRLWQLASGKRKISDEMVLKYEQEQGDLMSFRTVSGLNVASLEEAKAVATFAKDHGLSMELLAAAGPHFDTKSLTLRSEKIPAQKWQWISYVWGSVLALIASLSLALSFSESAILEFRDSGTVFALSTDRANAIGFWKERSTLDRFFCQSPVARGNQVGSFSLKEVNELCVTFTDREIKGYIERSVRGQRTALLMLFLMSAFFAWSAWRYSRQVAAAHGLSLRLAKLLKRAEVVDVEPSQATLADAVVVGVDAATNMPEEHERCP